MTPQALAILYAVLASAPFAMQIALAAGAPLGRFSVGGRFPGRLPPAWRVLAVVQAGLLVALAVTLLGLGGALPLDLPGWAIWPVLGLTAMTCLANLATPSRPERRLWGPVTVGMLAASIGVALL